MARFGKNPNTASCQFYITLAPQPKLDNQYAVFGGVINGMDVAKQIAKGDPFFVAIGSKEVVGWCDIQRRTGIASHVGLLNIAIVPGFRSQGIGRKLLLAVLDEAKRSGFVRIELWAHSDNARAIALYEKVGFVREGLLRATGVIDGEFMNSVVMAIIDADNAARACATN